MNFDNLRKWRGLFDNEAGLDAINTIRGMELPLALTERISEMSDPAHRFKGLVERFEEVYRNSVNKPRVLFMIKEAKLVIKSVFASLVSTGLSGYVPGPMQPLVGSMFDFGHEVLLLTQQFNELGEQPFDTRGSPHNDGLRFDIMNAFSTFSTAMRFMNNDLSIVDPDLDLINPVRAVKRLALLERSDPLRELFKRNTEAGRIAHMITTGCIQPLRRVGETLLGN